MYEWSSQDITVVMVSQDGIVQVVGVGETTLIVRDRKTMN